MARCKWKGLNFDSKFERNLWKLKIDDPNWEYHNLKLDYSATYSSPKGGQYTTLHKYTPDFTEKQGKNKPLILWESKGRFRTREDANKCIRMNNIFNNDKYEYRMLLYSGTSKVLGSKKLTMSGWCEKNNIKYITFKDLLS